MSKKKKKNIDLVETKPVQNKRQVIEQALAHLDADDPDLAIELLEPLSERYRKDGEIQYYLGFAYLSLGDLWPALKYFRRSTETRHPIEVYISLGITCFDLSLPALGTQAFRRLLQVQPDHPNLEKIKEEMNLYEEEVRSLSRQFEINPAKVEEGLRLIEEAQIALHDNEFHKSILMNRRAIRLLRNYPPLHNNLALALFYSGQPAEAVREAHQVLRANPGNIQALANLVRFEAWSGNLDQARLHWENLERQIPKNIENRLKIAEAAAILEEDEAVLRWLGKFDPESVGFGEIDDRMIFFMGVAEANLGKNRSARQHLELIVDNFTLAGVILESLDDKKRGIGWSERFPYFHVTELLPLNEWKVFTELIVRWQENESQRVRKELDRFYTRFPVLILIGKKLILEEKQTALGIDLLVSIGTPAAYEVLRQFGFGQVGEDFDRMQALMALKNAGQIPEHEPVRLWKNGEWREVRLQTFEIREKEMDYSPEANQLIEKASQAFEADDLENAAKWYLQAIALEPNAKEALNNLAAIYMREDKYDDARELFIKAIEIDPSYVLARSNLAIIALEDRDPKAASEWLEPLEEVQKFTPQEIVFLNYVRARIEMAEGNLDGAISYLKMVTQIAPDYKPAQELLSEVTMWNTIQSGFGTFYERMEKNWQRKRKKQQQQITTNLPSLAETFDLYPKDVLTGMARVILPWGGWSTLKKAELQQRMIQDIQDVKTLESIVDELTEDDRIALRTVLESGGSILWEEFDGRYGNDLGVSPYWNYHEPESIMGRLRLRALLVEATHNGNLILAIPIELRSFLKKTVGR